MVRFGQWSTTLALAEGFGFLIVALLPMTPVNRVANRLLAALLAIAALRLTPYVLGFAGVYEIAPWLSFAPFDLAMATGPLLWLYVRRLVTPVLPKSWWLHFIPAGVDLVYRLWAFSLPLAEKLHWNDTVHVRWIDPVETLASLASLAIYLAAAARFRRRYGAWLVDHVSDPHDHRQPWMATILAALAAWLAVSAGFDLVDQMLTPLSYANRFPEYLVFSGLILAMGLEGWRHAGHRFPEMSPAQPPVASAPARDWAEVGRAWRERIRREGWWREPRLTLAEVARRLGTNETYVSRAFNDGLGLSFNQVVNAMRVASVQAALRDADQDVLSLALDAGFASKASFNRVFREHSGLSPTAWRAAQRLKIDGDPSFGSTAEPAPD